MARHDGTNFALQLALQKGQTARHHCKALYGGRGRCAPSWAIRRGAATDLVDEFMRLFSRVAACCVARDRRQWAKSVLPRCKISGKPSYASAGIVVTFYASCQRGLP